MYRDYNKQIEDHTTKMITKKLTKQVNANDFRKHSRHKIVTPTTHNTGINILIALPFEMQSGDRLAMWSYLVWSVYQLSEVKGGTIDCSFGVCSFTFYHGQAKLLCQHQHLPKQTLEHLHILGLLILAGSVHLSDTESMYNS